MASHLLHIAGPQPQPPGCQKDHGRVYRLQRGESDS